MLIVSKPEIRSDVIVEYPINERLIKLPIQNYLNILEVVPNSAQIALINAVNSPNIRFIVAAISRRVGKTYISNVIGNLVSLYPGSNMLIIAPNYSLSQISWDLQLSFLRRFEIEMTKCNAKDRVIELENGSTIRLGSISQVDSCVGRSYDLIIFDEAALDNNGASAFNIQLRPTLDKILSKCIFISTPRGNNYFKTFYDYGFENSEWCSIKADWQENPRATLRDIESAKCTMSSAEFRQEYYADFIAIQGKIYELPIENVTSRNLEDYECVIGVDLGFRDPTAVAVCLTDGRSWHIVDEYQANGKSTRQYAEAVISLMDKWNADFVYIDSANQQMKYDFAAEYDIFTVNAKKDVRLGIGYMQGLVENGFITVSPECKHAVSMFANYSWDDRPGLLKETPKHDIHSHIADAIRYAIYSHSHILDVKHADLDAETTD